MTRTQQRRKDLLEALVEGIELETLRAVDGTSDSTVIEATEIKWYTDGVSIIFGEEEYFITARKCKSPIKS
jgi:hypothetical protein